MSTSKRQQAVELCAQAEVVQGRRPDALKQIFEGVGKAHLWLAGTSRAWRAVYAGLDKLHLTSVGNALASKSTASYALESAQFRDIHRFHRQQCK